MCRAVADGVDVVERRTAERIDIDAARSCRSCSDQGSDGGNDADAGDDDVAGDLLAAIGQSSADPAICPFDCLDPGGQPQVDTLFAVVGGIEIRKFGARDPCEDPVLHFHHGNFAAQLAQHRSRLEPDIAGADYDSPFCASGQFFLQRIDIAPRSHIVNTAQIAARAGQPSGIATGSPDQLAIGNPGIVRKNQFARNRIDFVDVPAKTKLDILVCPEFFGPDLDSLERLFAREIFLRQRRSFVRWVAVAADHEDGILMAVLPQGDGCLRTAVPRSHDDDIEMFHCRAGWRENASRSSSVLSS